MKCFFGIILCILTCSVTLAQNNTLNYYLETAKSKSPLLKDLRNQVAMSQLDSLRIRAGLMPQVNGSSAGLFAPVIHGFGYSGAITNVNTFNALVTVNKTIIGKQYLNSQLAAIGFQRDSIINLGKISELDLAKSITGQYITAYGSLEQYKFSREIVELLTKEDTILKKLTRANVYRQSDYLTFLVTLKQQQVALLQARLQYKNDFAILNYLSGIADTSMTDISEPTLQRTYTPEISSSIFFKKFQIDSMRFLNSRKLINYSYRPKLNVFADGGYESDFTYEPYKNWGTSFGFNLTIPIYDGGQRKLQFKRLALQQETSQYYRSFFDVQYRQQIALLNQQIVENEGLILKVKDQIRFTEALIKVDNELLQKGDLKVADLILAINNFLTVRNLLTQTTVSRLQLINQVNYWNK
jgi:outer membrane protein TolC